MCVLHLPRGKIEREYIQKEWCSHDSYGCTESGIHSHKERRRRQRDSRFFTDVNRRVDSIN